MSRPSLKRDIAITQKKVAPIDSSQFGDMRAELGSNNGTPLKKKDPEPPERSD